MKFTDRNNNQAAQTQHRSTYLPLCHEMAKWAFLSLFSFSAVKQANFGMKQPQIFALQADCSLFTWLVAWLVSRSASYLYSSVQLCFSLSLVCCLPLKKNIFPSQNIFLLFLLRSLLPRGMISNFALFNSENLSFLQMQCKSQNMISLGW